MPDLVEIWDWISDPSSQATLAFLGTSIVAIIATSWAVIQRIFFKSTKMKKEPVEMTMPVAVGGRKNTIFNFQNLPATINFISNAPITSPYWPDKHEIILDYWSHLRYSFSRKEYVHPLVVKELIGWISDMSSTIVAIDLDSSSKSNRFYGDVEQILIDKRLWLRCSQDSNEYRSPHFLYSYIGTSKTGVQILHCRDCGGGTGVWNYIALLAFEADTAMAPIESASLSRVRIILKILGTVSLGDRYEGVIVFQDDRLVIGKDRSPRKFGGRIADEVLEIR